MVDRLEAPKTSALLQPAARRLLGSLPLLLSGLFVGGVVVWAQRSDAAESLEQAAALQRDARSLDAQLRAQRETEIARLQALAAALPQEASVARGDADSASARLDAEPELRAGLERMWLNVIWLDDKYQVLASRGRQPVYERRSPHDLTDHLVAAVGSSAAGPGTHARLLARYSPGDLLLTRRSWWVAADYDVALVTTLGQVIATTEDPARPARGRSYALPFEPIPDLQLRLTLRNAPTAWYRGLPGVLVGGFFLLIIAATVLLRRQISQVSLAETKWRDEAAWRTAMEDSALVGLRARTADGELVYANQTFCELVGYTREELIGKTQMPYWPPECVEEIQQRNQNTLTGNAPRSGYESRWRHKSGRTIDVMLFESPLVDARGRQIGWMGSIVDITERKRLEERERRQIETAAHHARLTTLGEIASSLAHELNQPLTAIASYNAGVLKALSKLAPLEPALTAAVQEIGKQAALAGRIVHRIRERATQREPEPELCDLNQVLHDALDLQKINLRRQQVRVSLQLAAGLPEVRVDRVGIEQVVNNLLRNALESLSALEEERSRQIVVESALLEDAASPAVRVTIADNGCGLRGQSIETLTTPFFSDKPQGLGLGLAICRSIMERHRGTLSAEAAPSGGAQFSFCIPFEPAAHTAATQEAPPA